MIIILYILDSLRPDFLSCYGYKKDTSPNIDKLAQEGVIFTNAFAQSTWTRSSGASILSSTYPSLHGVFGVKDYFHDSIPRLTGPLQKNGFKTIAISTIGNISTDFGFGKGFDSFTELFKSQKLLEKRAKLNIRTPGRKYQWVADSDFVPITTSEDINQFLFDILDRYRKLNMFILVWSMDTHGPYFHRDPEMARACSPNEAVWSGKKLLGMHTEEDLHRLKSLYEDMIYYNDHHIGALIEKLKDLNLFEDTFFILMSDHGESFSEHGVNSHGAAPYDELIKIPLIMKFPNSQFKGKIDGLVQHVDLAPTVLNYLNIKESSMIIQGKSLLPLLEKQKEVNDFVFVEFQRNENLPNFTALRNKEFKYLEAKPGKFTFRKSILQTLSPLVRSIIKQKYLFNLKNDPWEKVNLIKKEKRIAKELSDQLQAILKMNQNISVKIKRNAKDMIEIDKEVANQLKALGYFE